ncbi:MAG: hypothetical protein GX431_00080 [Bacteroidales bacterium]|jgi:hypothetical protein|nr:hypothetical protein [Bacteroidales bacterium]
MGFGDAELVTPSNETSYADLAGEKSRLFRINSWKGFVAFDFLRKLYRETMQAATAI